MSERRYKTVQVKLSTLQRFRHWWSYVKDAVRTIPPSTYRDWVEVSEDDPEYENAPWAMTTELNAPRFKFVNGKYERIE